jgi:predicted DNA-binding protein
MTPYSIILDRQTRDQAEALGQHLGQTKAQVIREAINLYFKDIPNLKKGTQPITKRQKKAAEKIQKLIDKYKEKIQGKEILLSDTGLPMIYEQNGAYILPRSAFDTLLNAGLIQETEQGKYAYKND